MYTYCPRLSHCKFTQNNQHKYWIPIASLMSILLPSKSKNVVSIILNFLQMQSEEDMCIFIKYCIQQKNIYKKNLLGTALHTNAMSNIFVVCRRLKIASMFPDAFYGCLYSAKQKLFEHTIMVDALRGLDVLN
jgi:hypothetical protein